MIKSRKNKLLKGNNGITLIALVITIIVLIILAGVSIKIVLGENGLVEKTKYAKEKQTIETIREKLDIVKGSDYIEQIGNSSIDTYFETLEKEKIEPYTITNKLKLTENTGIIEVDNKYSYIVTIQNNKDIKIEYEGKVDEITREPDEVTITIAGENNQTNLPVILSANIKVGENDITAGKYIINTTVEELGTEDNLYTEQITDSNIDVTLGQANTYYIHTLTADKYGRKQETIKGPITIETKYHVHTGNSSSGGGCYTVHHYSQGTWKATEGSWSPGQDVNPSMKCPRCGASIDTWDAGGGYTQWACSKGCGSYTGGYNYWSIGCGKNTATLEGYIVNY